MIITGVNSSWRSYDRYIWHLLTMGHLDLADYLLSSETGILHKDGKPLKTNKMEPVKITPPEGYEIDKEKSTLEQIYFKKKDNKPRSWEELKKLDGWYIGEMSNLVPYSSKGTCPFNRNTFPTKEYAEASLALAQLLQLRQRWIGDWEPNWDGDESKSVITVFGGKLRTDSYCNTHFVLSFPNFIMAKNFLNTFVDLLEIAKPLL